MPKYDIGQRVFIWKTQKFYTVMESHYRQGDWEYILMDDEGVQDEGWFEDELSSKRIPAPSSRVFTLGSGWQ